MHGCAKPCLANHDSKTSSFFPVPFTPLAILFISQTLLTETLRCLVLLAKERHQRMDELLSGLKSVEGALPLSAEAIVSLIEQHLKCRGASRLRWPSLRRKRFLPTSSRNTAHSVRRYSIACNCSRLIQPEKSVTKKVIGECRCDNVDERLMD